jgi:hypothetical protein
VSGRKIGMLLLLLAFGATVETAWQVRGHVGIGPEGCRVMGGRFYGPSYSFEQTAERAVSPHARLEVRNAFGEVRVTPGAAGVVRVKLRKVVYLPTEEKARAFADRVELRIAGEGDPLTIGTNREDLGRSDDVGLETHLEIEAPADSAVRVRNEHGRVDLSGFASAEVDSSFDGVTVARIAGDARVESKHGDVNVSEVGGAASVTSRHGGVEVSGVRGPVTLDVQHGDTTARRTGAVEADQQFGRFTASSVAGDLVLRGAHSEVDVSDVTGRAEVETSFGGAQLARIGGGATVKAEHGRVSAEDVGGGLSAKSTHGDAVVRRVDGKAEIEADHGAVDAAGLGGGARVRATNGDVDLDGFSGEVVVDVDRGAARLAPRAAIAAPITVNVRNGEATLRVPEGSRATVDAESRRGEVRSGVSGFTVPDEERRGPGRRVKGAIGGGGPDVQLRADGDVSLESHGSASAIADRPVAKPSLAATPQPEATPASSTATPLPEAPATPSAPHAPRPEEAAKPDAPPPPAPPRAEEARPSAT